ncbi:PREDICTED: transcription factor bHLH47 [Tarenaya hassleriana]|uniref:transcription factor bHLH47 n=1 Tax=Tarenaya hassleriana TaxID=28532 RepID=UPI00053C18B3|nr:PREDICTED: transcription factor bHLH47 [Tarenaya hassleriana]XP_019058614.1 PREDICTED: transcription factor bHLH47 [Tarenaya hassleriana]
MGSKTASVLADQVNSSVGSPNNRSTKGKAPRSTNKAAREKLKREHLNELFLELANALELDQPNSGKASVLSEATRFLKDLFGQIECLRKENACLLSESHYVTAEKNELKEETSALETQISELQTGIEARANQSKPDINASSPPENQHRHTELASRFPGLPAFRGGYLVEQQPSAPTTTVLVLPVQPDLQTYNIADTTQTVVKQSSNVRKPHPRYPSVADSWQSRLLADRSDEGE